MRLANYMNRWIDMVAALFLLLYLYTAISKLRGLTSFERVLSGSSLIGPYARWLAPAIPAIELLLCVLLFVPRWRYTGLVFSTALIIVFTIYIAYMIVFSPGLPCSCGGVISSLSWKEHLLLNSCFAAGGLSAILFHHKFRSTRGSRKPAEQSRPIYNRHSNDQL